MRAAFGSLCALLLGGPVFGQSCSDPALAGYWGAWSERDAADVQADGSVPAEAQAAVLAKLEALARPFAVLYPRPRIGETKTHERALIAYPEIGDGPYSYEFYAEVLPRACNAGRLDDLDSLVGKELETAVYVNSLHLLLRELENFQIDGRPVYSLARQAGTWRGHTVYESEWIRTGKAILLTHGGRLPVKPVSQDQYLQAAHAQAQSLPSQQAAVDDETEALFQQQLDDARKMPPGEQRDQLVANFEQALKDIRAQRAKGSAKLASAANEDAAVIEQYVASHSTQNLAQPAVTFHSSTFRGSFPSADEQGAYPLVQIDGGYFDGKLPKDAAQLIVFFWNWAEDDAATREWRAGIEAKFPVDALQQALDR
jgi:hypothetical protein